MIYLILVGLAFFLHTLLKLNWYMSACVMLFLLLIYPSFRRLYQLQKKQENRFFSATNYMDTLLYSFLREQKIEAAITDVLYALPESEMKICVKRAHDHMQMTFDNSDAVAGGLHIIEEAYPSVRIKNIHDFLLHVESYGGNMENAIRLLIEDKNYYENRIRQTMEERKKGWTEVVLSVVASLLICGMILYIPVRNMDISSNWLVQILAVFVIILDGLILHRAQKYLTEDWLTIDGMLEETDYEGKIKDFYQYNEKREQKLSIILGLITGCLTLILFFFKQSWGAVFMLAVFLVMINQHKIGHFLAKKRIVRQIQGAFPKWLMELVLLLQSENVQVALEKSKEHVPSVLRFDLEELLDRIEIRPEAAEPYHKFLECFRLPEIASTMSMLYALSVGNSASAGKQISELIDKNQRLLDLAEKQRMKDKNSGMYLLFLAPVMTASLKMLVDMAIFMLSFLSSSAI